MKRKTCSSCSFVWEHPRADFIFRLHFPALRKKSYTLQEIIEANLSTSISDVNCTICKQKTPQTVEWHLDNDYLLLELLRGEERLINNTHSSVTFNPAHIEFRKNRYHVIATSHHSGGIASGHWVTKIKMQDNTWWLLDSLNSSAEKTTSKNLFNNDLIFILLMKIKTCIPILRSSRTQTL